MSALQKYRAKKDDEEPSKAGRALAHGATEGGGSMLGALLENHILGQVQASGKMLHRTPRVTGAAGLAGLVKGAATQSIGDSLLGTPEEHSFNEEGKRGAVGGAIYEGAHEMARMGAKMKLEKFPTVVRYLMQAGMSPAAAKAAALGGRGLRGAVLGAVGGGLTAGLLNRRSEEE